MEERKVLIFQTREAKLVWVSFLAYLRYLTHLLLRYISSCHGSEAELI